MFNLSHNQSTMKKQNFQHIAVTVTLSNIDSSHLTLSIYNDNNQNNWKQRMIADVNIELSYVFAITEVCVDSYVSYFQLLESTKIFCLR